MGNVLQINKHPRYQRKIPMEIEFTYDWSNIQGSDPKRMNFLRVDRTEEQAQHLEALYATGILSDSQRILLAETKEELQVIADGLGVDHDEQE